MQVVTVTGSCLCFPTGSEAYLKLSYGNMSLTCSEEESFTAYEPLHWCF